MTDRKSQPFWAVVGQISAIIGLVIGAVGVYRVFWPDEAVVRASCRYAAAPWPARLMPQPPALSLEATEDAAARAASRLTHVKPAEAAELGARIVADVLSAARLDWSRPEIPGGVLSCTVENSGSKLASDVVLQVPFDISDVEVGPNREPSPITSGLVKLGELHPDSSATVVVWTRYGWSPLLGGLRLSHTGGRGVVTMPVEAWGWLAWFVRYWGALVLAALVLLFAAATFPWPGKPPASKQDGVAAEQRDAADEAQGGTRTAS